VTDQEFVEAFETCRLPNDQFHHRDHLRLAWIYLGRYGASAAAVRIAESIRRYASQHGASAKYHETVTIAWLHLVAESARRCPGSSFDQLLQASPELVDKNTLHQYYSPELLASETARIHFVPPDRKALPEKKIPDSLRVLLTHLIDYAGLFPPAALSWPEVAQNYTRYLASPEGWMLNRLVLPARLVDAQLPSAWRVTLLVEDEPGPLPPRIETLETKAARRLSLPTYCEAPLAEINGAFAKIRTGGLTPHAIPPSEEIADFLHSAAARSIPFKATAGLHHPIRSFRPLTYSPDSPHAVMHGFINVFVAAAFAWLGAEQRILVDILNESDASAFQFLDGEMLCRGMGLGTAQIAEARRDFAHSFGSCSFEEPIADLKELGWLP